MPLSLKHVTQLLQGCMRELLAQVMVVVMMLLLVFGEYDVGEAIVACSTFPPSFSGV